MVLVDSRSRVYRLWRPFVRPVCRTETGRERIHRSVLARRRGPKGAFEPHPYEPANLRALEREGTLEPFVAELDPLYEQLEAQEQAASPHDRREAAGDARKL
jgi:hypothetical protein